MMAINFGDNFEDRFSGQKILVSDELVEEYNAATLDKAQLLSPSVNITSILCIQALGMTLREQARVTLKSNERKHGFSMLENSDTIEQVDYDGSLEEYMTFRVAKTNHDQWKMRVRFRQNLLTEETSVESYLDDYMFDWLKNGNRMAFCTNRRIKVEEDGRHEDIRNISAITDEDAAELLERMTTHADKVAITAISKL